MRSQGTVQVTLDHASQAEPGCITCNLPAGNYVRLCVSDTGVGIAPQPPHLGVEVSLFDLGRAGGSIDVPGVGTVTVSARVRGIGIAGVLIAPVGPVSLFAKAGIANVRAQLESSVSTGLPGSESSWQPSLGVGLSYPIDHQFAVRGEWERVRARFLGGETDNVDLLSVGWSYRV